MAAPHDWTGSHLPAASEASSDWSASSIPAQSPVSNSFPESYSLAEYDPFARYGSSLHGPYDHGVYTPPHASRPPSLGPSLHPQDAPRPLGLARPQPIAAPSQQSSSSRRVSTFSQSSRASGISTPKPQMEDNASASASASASYGSSSLGPAHSISLRPSPPYMDPAMPYFGSSPLSSWSRSESEPAPGQLYAEAHGQDPEAVAGQQEVAFGSRLQQQQQQQQQHELSRRKRSPRRLTTLEEANFQCEVPGCGKLFNRNYNFKAHMETHDKNREYPFPCQVEGCRKKFVRRTDLQRHHSSIHAKEKNHKCDYCGRPFARKDTLRRHMEDGCARRFDVGTLDIRASDTYGGLGTAHRPLGVEATSQAMSPMPHLSTLSRMATPTGHYETTMVRTRSLEGSGEGSGTQHHSQGYREQNFFSH
ncbi:hypothetical protein SODALDRAFT_321039 [Sodiomyces alkalinus F11]|uniref:C2H2-type domain-containing protein n=1 Tax=Sodiomyces alkalinus (strain CBS 110278 / VKM F-3762 / F11) TaxID=1314773 RepID=A0A3N2PKA5_SODAK|nr:hypothetical protein SODALDRAFT_321039 [Sodiomyces alkalinus F11]ROT34943.1 hypothetical protein SODALDRAFT_321039 [Sodiomyces alkalinus F11]